MMTVAVVFERPEQLQVRSLELAPPDRTQPEVLVEVEWTGISTGTERLLYRGQMPAFPGLGYPLVPGYETVGRVVEASRDAGVAEGDRVYVPGSSCFRDVRGLFGGAASHLRVPAARVARIDDGLGESGVLLALAATAQHALSGGRPADLIVGHGVLGRLLARLSVVAGGRPVVWEKNPARAAGAVGYTVVSPDDDPRRDYRSIYDVSGDASLVDTLVGRLARGGELVLAGFYDRIQFGFPVAFMKEARLRIAAEWKPQDLRTVLDHLSSGAFDLDGLITHRRAFDDAPEAYGTAFEDPDCLKMILEWRTRS
jgi:3-hydroxyethyl bacteriochlorophyllide a dehydrogenase